MKYLFHVLKVIPAIAILAAGGFYYNVNYLSKPHSRTVTVSGTAHHDPGGWVAGASTSKPNTPTAALSVSSTNPSAPVQILLAVQHEPTTIVTVTSVTNKPDVEVGVTVPSTADTPPTTVASNPPATPTGGQGGGDTAPPATTPTPPTTPPVTTPTTPTPPVTTPVTPPCESNGRVLVPIGGNSCSFTITTDDGTPALWFLPTLSSIAGTAEKPNAPVYVVIESSSQTAAGSAWTASSITFHYSALATAVSGDYTDSSNGLVFSTHDAAGTPLKTYNKPLTIVATP